MSKSQPWSPSEDALCRMLVEQGKTSADIADIFADQGIQRTQRAIMVRSYRQGWRAHMPPSPVVIEPPPTMEGDALLLFDIHSPCHDARFIDACIDLALKMGIKKCGIGGDLVDFNAFSFFQKAGFDVDAEIDTTEKILSALESIFDEIVYSNGNHEDRLSRLTGWLLPVQQAVRLFMRTDKTTFSRAYWFTLISGGEKYYIEHPKNVSAHATVVPKALAAKYHCHVIAGHGHLWGESKDISGEYRAIDSGVCADPQRIEYYMMRHSVRPAMCQGAVIVKDGVPLLLDPEKVKVYLSYPKRG